MPALSLFRAVETQFRWQDGAPTGLDYCGVRAAPAFRALPRDRREAVFADVCVMERPWINATVRDIIARRQSAQGAGLGA